MPAYRDRCVSLDLGKKNMGMFVGNMRHRSIDRWRKIDLMSSEYAGKNPNAVLPRIEKFVEKMPRARVVLIEKQFHRNRIACNLQKQLKRCLRRCPGVTVKVIDPSAVRKWFNLTKGKRAKKLSAVDVAADILTEGSRLTYTSPQATADVAAFLACKKRDDYADSLLQWLYALETGLITAPPPSSETVSSKCNVITIDD